jgi:hypothetical protein
MYDNGTTYGITTSTTWIPCLMIHSLMTCITRHTKGQNYDDNSYLYTHGVKHDMIGVPIVMARGISQHDLNVTSGSA